MHAVGMRDYYNLVKMLKRKLTDARMQADAGSSSQEGTKPSWFRPKSRSADGWTTDLVTSVVCRNFGGHRQLRKQVVMNFMKQLGLPYDDRVLPKTAELAAENRHAEDFPSELLLRPASA